jgi:hypothetical protein
MGGGAMSETDDDVCGESFASILVGDAHPTATAMRSPDFDSLKSYKKGDEILAFGLWSSQGIEENR